MPTHYVEGYTIDRPRDDDRNESLFLMQTYPWRFTRRLDQAMRWASLEDAQRVLDHLQRGVFAHHEWDYHFRITERSRVTRSNIMFSELGTGVIQ